MGTITRLLSVSALMLKMLPGHTFALCSAAAGLVGYILLSLSG